VSEQLRSERKLLCSALHSRLRWQPGSAMAESVTLKVDGMMCNGCRGGVEGALKGVEGVESCTVDLDSGLAHVTGKAEVSALIKAVEGKGKTAELVAGKEMTSAIDAALQKAKAAQLAKAVEPAPAAPSTATPAADVPATTDPANPAQPKDEGVPMCRLPQNCIIA